MAEFAPEIGTTLVFALGTMALIYFLWSRYRPRGISSISNMLYITQGLGAHMALEHHMQSGVWVLPLLLALAILWGRWSTTHSVGPLTAAFFCALVLLVKPGDQTGEMLERLGSTMGVW